MARNPRPERHARVCGRISSDDCLKDLAIKQRLFLGRRRRYQSRLLVFRIGLTKIREPRAHTSLVRSNSVCKRLIAGKRENDVHHVVSQSTTVEACKIEGRRRPQFVRQDCRLCWEEGENRAK